MIVQDVGQQLLTQIDLRFRIVVGMALVFDHLEPEVVERSTHLIKAVLGFHHDFVEAVSERPRLLLLGQRAEMALSAPVAARSSNPRVEDAAVVELDVIPQTGHEVR